MKKITILLIFVLLTAGLFIPKQVVSACYGITCRKLDAGEEYDPGGEDKCSESAYTVYGGYAPTGTNGRVFNELRYSANCHSNWSRGTIWASNQGTIYLYVRAKEVPTGYTRPNHRGGWVLPYGFTLYSDMVNGEVTVSSFAGISSVEWFGPYDPSSEYSG